MNRWTVLVVAGFACFATACGGSTPAATPSSGAPASSSAAAETTTETTTTGSAAPRPVACAGVTDEGKLSQSSASQVTLDQIGQAVGFKVTIAMPDPQSALAGFRGYEGCRYQFDTPAGGAQVDVALVVGTNPLDKLDAAAEFDATKSTRKPMSKRNSTCLGNGCGDETFTDVPGVGDAALAWKTQTGDEVIVVRAGRMYLEIGPGGLKEERMVNLAKLIVSSVR